MDDELQTRLRGLPYSVVKAEFDQSLSDLWVQRARVWAMLADEGVEFINCDSDAVWLRNPIPIYSDEEFDLLFSQATLHPRDVYGKWGFTLCCGFFWARPTLPTRRLFHALISPAEIVPGYDDQVALNRLLEREGTTWMTLGKERYNLFRDALPFDCFHEIVHGNCEKMNLKLGMLPHHLFPRLQPGAPEAIVRHVLQNRKDEERIDLMRAAGCWRLDEHPEGFVIRPRAETR